MGKPRNKFFFLLTKNKPKLKLKVKHKETPANKDFLLSIQTLMLKIKT